MKILVVEDNEDIRESVSLALQSEGYSTILTANGQEALAWLKRQHNSSNEIPDLIISDLNMPIMNGIELFRTLKTQKWNPIPFIFMTSQHQFTSEPVLLIKKPFELDLFLQVIRTAIES